MIACIDLPPDGCPAQYHGRARGWTCPIPAALPVLEYFTEKALGRMDPNERQVEEYVGRQVVAALAGARFRRMVEDEDF